MNKNKAIVWGTGIRANEFLHEYVLFHDYEIVACADNNPEKWGGGSYFCDRKVISPNDVLNSSYDCIIICIVNWQPVKMQLVDDFGIDESKIRTYEGILQDFLDEFIERYRESEDEDIRRLIADWKVNLPSVYGYYHFGELTADEVHFDEELSYIFFEGKKMYYHKNYPFVEKNGKKYINYVLGEQHKGSPHLYIRDAHEIKDGSVIVYAGVCEGNFSLRYVENCKKIYLIESEAEWIEALKYIFESWKDRVVFCDKFLSRYDSEHTIRLDSLVKEPIDFLKMDIEGAEVDALLGGKYILTKSTAQCAICSYHKRDDEEHIKYLLNSVC